MKKLFFRVFLILPIFLMTGSEASYATPPTLGQVLANAMNGFSNFPNLLTTFAYLMGLFLAILAMFKFKEHVDTPQQVKISEGVKRLIAGGMFLALPMMIEAAYNTISGNVDGVAASASGRHAVAVTPGVSLDEMLLTLMVDISGPMSFIITAFSYIAGLVLLLVGINRLTKSAQEGPRGPGGMGTLMTFLAAGALMSVDRFAGAFQGTLFGTTQVFTYATLGSATSAGMTAAEIDRIEQTLEGIIYFISLVGWIAFIRGIFVMKAYADGNTQTSLMQAVVFLISGAIAINFGGFVTILHETLGLNALGFGATFS